jgi:zinc protease
MGLMRTSNYRALAVLLVVPILTQVLMLKAASQTLPINTTRLPNGHAIHVVEKHEQPIITIDTWVDVGSSQEMNANNGITHFLEHLIFKGTPKHKAGVADAIIENKGAVFNAATSSDYTHFYITLPSRFFDEALALHADMLLNATIPTPELDRERPVVQEEINRSTDNPQRQLYTQFMAQLFPGHGYSQDTLGPKRNIATLPRQTIMDYYHNWYTPSRFHTIIVGDITPDKAVAAVKQAFVRQAKADTPPAKGNEGPVAALAKPEKTAVNAGIKPVQSSSVRVNGLDNIKSLYWTAGWQGPKVAEVEDMVALDAAMYALGGGKNSRLHKQLVEQAPLVNQVVAYNMSLKEAGALQIYAELKPEQWATVNQTLSRNLVDLLHNGITQQELDAFKVQTLTEKKYSQETTDGLSNQIGYFAITSKLSDMDRYMDAVNALTVADVQRVLPKYIDLTKSTVSAIAPSKHVDAVTRQQQQWVHELPQTPLTPMDKSATVKTATVKSVTLPNKTRLLLNPTEGAQTTTVKLFAPGGQRAEPKPGIASLAAILMTKGTTNRSTEALNDALDANGLSLSVVTNDDHLEVTASATAEQFGLLQALLLDVLQNPAFSQSELDKAKTRMKQAIEASRDDLGTRAKETFYQSLYPNHPYGAVGQRLLDSVDSITLDDIKQYVAQSFQPDQLVLVLSGKLPHQPEHVARQLVSKTPCQTLAIANNPVPPADTMPRVKPPAAGLHAVSLPNIAASQVIHGYQAPAIGSRDYPAAKLLAAVLGSGLSSRLFVNLREKRSLAYSVGASLKPGLQASTFLMVGGTDPKNQSALADGMQRELAALAKTPLTEAELQNVKDKVIGQFALGHETPAEQAQLLGYYEAMGLGYQFDTQYPKLLQQVTAKQIQAVAKHWVSQPVTTAIVQPQKSKS